MTGAEGRARRDADRGGSPPVVAMFLLGSIVALGLLLAWSGGDVDGMTFGDGTLHRVVASDLGATGVGHDLRDAPLRYGRIGLPALLWATSAGNANAMRWVQPLIMILAAGGVVAAAGVLLGVSRPVLLLAPFVAIGLDAGIAGGYAEPLALALGLLGVVAATRERWWLSAASLAGAMLTRENAGVVLLGIALWLVMARRFRPALIVVSSLVPVLAWHAVVAARLGAFPLRDPWLRGTTTVEPPIVALWHTLTGSSALSLAWVVIHLLIAFAAVTLWRGNSVVSVIAAASSIQLLFAGPDAWRYVGDAARLSIFLEAFTILAVLERCARALRSGGPADQIAAEG